MKKILLINTGGTLSSTDKGEGLSPDIAAEEILGYIPELREELVLHALQIFSIESPDLVPSQWGQIVRCIRSNYEDYDGFVLIHGTDTLAYTSSALSRMIKGGNKPIVITGAQYSIEETVTDAVKNLLDSCRFAANWEGGGVYVVFHGHIMLGDHVKKIRGKDFEGFESVTAPDVGRIYGREIRISGSFLQSDTAPDFQDQIEDKVFLLKFYPGITPDLYDFVKDHFRGVVLECYGLAGIPHNFIPLIEMWNQLGIAILVCTQCTYQGTDLSLYTVGHYLTKERLVEEGREMTCEAAMTKLMVSLAQ
ncbi:MAG: asparaginase [Tissierellia bacterium]|nr:asparaginase [Tissierellia bacterium]